MVIRGRRDGAFGFFGLEAISAHNIGFFGGEAGVVGIVACDVIAAVGNAIGGGGDAGAEGVREGEAGGVDEEVKLGASSWLADLTGFACFARTCSCSLVLLGYFSGQRLHAKASVFSLAMRIFSACMTAGSNLLMRRSKKCCNNADFKLSDRSSCHCLISPFKQ